MLWSLINYNNKRYDNELIKYDQQQQQQQRRNKKKRPNLFLVWEWKKKRRELIALK